VTRGQQPKRVSFFGNGNQPKELIFNLAEHTISLVDVLKTMVLGVVLAE
jgi:hypothetical protein